MEKTTVRFEGGTTRIGDKGCNYMIANAVDADVLLPTDQPGYCFTIPTL